MTNSIQGNVALVTGGTTGMGFATAKKLAELGVKVLISSRSADKGAAALRELRTVSGDVHFVQADVSQASDVENLVNTTISTFGRLDLAFNNAGIEALGPLGETSVRRHGIRSSTPISKAFGSA